MSNSWYIIITVDEITIKHIILCQCGHREEFLLTTFPFSELKKETFNCSECNNHDFIFATNFIFFDFDIYTPFEILKCKKYSWYINIKDSHDSYIGYATLNIPTKSANNNQIEFVPYQFAKVEISQNGVIKKCMIDPSKETNLHIYIRHDKLSQQDPQTNAQEIVSKIEREMLTQILQKPFTSINWMKQKYKLLLKSVKNLEQLTIYLKNQNIKEVELTKWIFFDEITTYLSNFKNIKILLQSVFNHREETVLLKLLYTQYKNDIKINNIYNPKADFIFSRTIKNHDLLKLLMIDNYNKATIFHYAKVADVIWIINFLKNYYSEKEIVRLFLNIDNQIVFNNILMIVEQNKRAIEKYFTKSKCSLSEIHKKLMQSVKLYYYNEKQKIFNYPQGLAPFYHEIDDLIFQLPKTTKELYSWSLILDNCLDAYIFDIDNYKTVIYGVFIKNELKYAVEIRNNVIIQAYGYKNTPVNKAILQKMKKWAILNDFKFLISKELV